MIEDRLNQTSCKKDYTIIIVTSTTIAAGGPLVSDFTLPFMYMGRHDEFGDYKHPCLPNPAKKQT